MRLTNFTDYALRMLMFAASTNDERFNIDDVARAFGISKTHLNKVANTLTRAGYLTAVRGRNGGLMLGRKAEDIGIGDVIRLTEPDFALVECFATGSQCILTCKCKLSGMFGEAMAAFQTILDSRTLADIIPASTDFLGEGQSQRLQIRDPSPI